MKKSLILLVCMIGLILPSMLAPAMTVRADYHGKVATWQLPSVNTTGYQLTSPIDLMAGKKLIGTITNLSFCSASDPALNLNFKIHADTSATFTFDTGVLTFPDLVNPLAYCSAAATLTSDAGGATLTGNFAGGKAYEATFNGGTVFADLVSSFNADPNTSNVESDRLPGGTDFATIPGSVSSMRAQWNFNLTDGDDASGTSRFDIEPGSAPPAVPDASTLALSLCGAVMALLGVRRHKYA